MGKGSHLKRISMHGRGRSGQRLRYRSHLTVRVLLDAGCRLLNGSMGQAATGIASVPAVGLRCGVTPMAPHAPAERDTRSPPTWFETKPQALIIY